jgi:hypothetical protein
MTTERERKLTWEMEEIPVKLDEVKIWLPGIGVAHNFRGWNAARLPPSANLNHGVGLVSSYKLALS